jgi:hypothetical protein
MSDPYEVLATSPALRQALRQLYPEFPIWIRRFLALGHEHPTVTLPPRILAFFNDPSLARAHLDASVARLTATAPQQGWHVQPKGEWQSIVDATGRHRILPGGLVQGIAVDTSGRTWGIRLASHHGLVTISRDTSRSELKQRFSIEWTPNLSHHESLLLSLFMDENRLFRMPNYGAGVGTDPWPPFADGRGHHIPDRGRTWDTRRPPVTDVTSAERLAARWAAVRLAEHRTEILNFWLGHPHPTLAAAGMMIATHPHLTRGTAPR